MHLSSHFPSQTVDPGSELTQHLAWGCCLWVDIRVSGQTDGQTDAQGDEVLAVAQSLSYV